MAMIECDECGAAVSSKAPACPKCGNPIFQAPVTTHQSRAVNPEPLPSNKKRLAIGLAIGLIGVIVLVKVLSSSSSDPNHSEPPVSSSSADSDANSAREAAAVASEAAVQAQAAAADAASAASAKVAAQKCDLDLQCAGDKYIPVAEAPCQRLIEDRARRIAKWDYKVEREHWYTPFTSSMSWTGPSHQNLTYHGDQAKFQNGFGAWSREKYACVFNIASQKVTGAYFESEGGIAWMDATAGERAAGAAVPETPSASTDSGTTASSEKTFAFATASAPADAAAPDQTTTGQEGSASDSGAYTTSFDCKKAHSTSEMLICGDADLAALDIDLATMFQQAKAAATDKQAFSDMTRRNWNWRNKNCVDKNCLVHWYADQRRQFLEILNPATQASGEQPADDIAKVAQTPTASDSDQGYGEKVGRRVKPNIVWAGGSVAKEAVIAVRCAPTGTLLSATIATSSGNDQWDAAALRAVQRTDPMPVGTDGRAPAEFTIGMRP